VERVKVCPKCGGEMEVGFMPGAPYWKPGKGLLGLTAYRILGIDAKNAVT